MVCLSTSLLALAALALDTVSGRPMLGRRSSPEMPANDPFYIPPSGFQSTSPGTILRSRSIEAGFLGLVPENVNAYQLLYRTTAVNGSAIATVTTILQPKNAATDRFVSFQTAYDSSNTKCDPSYAYQEGAEQEDLIISAEEFLIEGLLIEGWVVAAPDYEGPDAAFGPGHLEGMGVLDGMKAVQNFHSTLGMSATPMIAGVGYSGGSIATGWAASLKSSYAPSLNVKGWTMGGTPANLTGTLEYLSGSLFAGFSFAAVDGLAKPSAYGHELTPVLDSILTSDGNNALDFAADNCAITNLIAFLDESFLSTSYQSDGANLPHNPTIASVLDQNIMGVYKNQTPTPPVYLYHASQDEVIPYGDAETLVNSWCANGATVEFTTFAAGGHLTTEILGFPGAVKFVQSVFGSGVAHGCTRTTTLNNTLDPLALGANLEPVLNKLIQGLDLLGNQDGNVVSNISTLNQNIN